MRCDTFRCPKDAMIGHRLCAYCTISIERDLGGAGFYMHGRDPSDLYARALAEIEREQQERLRGHDA